MSAAAKATPSEPADLTGLSEELVRTHNPADAYERMLVTQIAQSWLRLQRAQDAEQRYCATRDMVEVLTTKLAEFKAVTRWVTDCDRAWRHAVTMLQTTQRRRQRDAKASQPAARRANPQPHSAAPATAPLPVANSGSSPFAAIRRE